MSDALALITGDILATRDSFNAVLVDRSISFERESGFAIQILQANEYALGVARNNRQSVVDAVTNVAALGVSLNPARKQAYLVPRDKKICLDISWMGLIDLAVQCGSIVWAQANVVYDTEELQIVGYDKPPVHKRNPFAKDKGNVVGAYCVAKLPSGDFLTETMSIDEINSVRDRSSAWKAWIEKQKKCPWVTDEAEMQRKTVVKRASKYWPRVNGDSRLEQAIHHVNVDGGEGLAEVVAAEQRQSDVSSAITRLTDIKSEPELNTYYAQMMGEYAKSQDGASARTFKSKALERREQLRAANTVDMQGATP